MTAETHQFKSFGEQLLAIVAADTGRRVDPRLHQRAAAAGGSEAVPSDGGFLVAPEFSRAIVQRMYETGEIFRRCLEVPITSSEFKFPQFDEGSRASGSRLGGIQCLWENEAASMKASGLLGTPYTQKPGFNLSTVRADKLTGYLHVTDELSRDSNAFDTWATYAFGQELMFCFEQAIVTGSGAGQPLGVLNAPATITAPIVNGQQSKSIVSDNIYGMLASLWSKSYNSAGTVWLYNQAALPQLAKLATIVGTAGSQSNLFQWANSPDEYDLLAGFPAMISEYCPYPGTPGDIVLADFSRYIVAVRELLRAEVSIHVRFLSDEDTFRFIMRAGGAPIDRSPVQALNGGSPPFSTSPYVILAAR